MVFSELRWNYSPLKEKAVLLPDGLFVFSVAELRFAPHRYGVFLFIRIILLLIAGRSAATGLAAISFWTEFVAKLRSTTADVSYLSDQCYPFYQW